MKVFVPCASVGFFFDYFQTRLLKWALTIARPSSAPERTVWSRQRARQLLTASVWVSAFNFLVGSFLNIKGLLLYCSPWTWLWKKIVGLQESPRFLPFHSFQRSSFLLPSFITFNFYFLDDACLCFWLCVLFFAIALCWNLSHTILVSLFSYCWYFLFVCIPIDLFVTVFVSWFFYQHILQN